MYRHTMNRLLLRCLNIDEAILVMADIYEGICDAHQAGIKMRWLLRRHKYFWPSITQDCIDYEKGCISCQIHGPIQHVPKALLKPIIKP